jgi:hypothetical protein
VHTVSESLNQMWSIRFLEMDTNSSSSPGTIEWDSAIKKEARGLDDYDLGEVQEVTGDHVVTQKGTENGFKYPKIWLKVLMAMY